MAASRISPEFRITWWDRVLMSFAPKWGMERVRARAHASVLARHYEAAQGSRRTSNWQKFASDANVANGPALTALRELSRDLRRNNGWARRGVEVIANNTVGWGIKAKPNDRSRARSDAALQIWNTWAGSTACDYDGRLNFYGLQALAMETIVESGEVLILKQPAATQDGLPIPMRLQVLEPDYLDTTRNAIKGDLGGPIIDGVEFDKFGRRVAYWLFSSHPGGYRIGTTVFQSQRVDADRVLHVFRQERPGQVRGVPWLAAAITRLKDLDDFEDAELMQQKVAACFGAFVTDQDPSGTSIGQQDDTDPALEHLEPGHIAYLPPGKEIKFAQPPTVSDSAFSERSLRRIAVTLGVTFEDLAGDFSRVNFSSARMARLSHWANVHKWQWLMLIPQMCGGVWNWAMDYVVDVEGWPTAPVADWAVPPMPIIEPDKEGLAYQRLLRIGAITWPQMISELGNDPVAQLAEIAAYNEKFDAAGVVFDSDARKTNNSGQQQQLPVSTSSDAADATDATDEGDGTDSPTVQ